MARTENTHPTLRWLANIVDQPLSADPIGHEPIAPQIRDAGCRASAEATASESDDSTDGSATTEPAMESIAHVTSGPEATSSQGNADLAPVATDDDLEPRDLAWKRGDHSTPRDLDMDNFGLTERMFR